MSDHFDERNEEFLSFSPPIVPWHQITSFSVIQPFNSTRLHCAISQMTNIRKLELNYRCVDDLPIDWKEKGVVNVLSDAALCDTLRSNGLRQLNLFTVDDNGNSDWTNIAYFIVERLCHLEIIELHGMNDQLIQMAHILINGLLELKFLTFVGSLQEGHIYEKRLRDLQNSNTRSFRTEVPNTMDNDTVFIWL